MWRIKQFESIEYRIIIMQMLRWRNCIMKHHKFYRVVLIGQFSNIMVGRNVKWIVGTKIQVSDSSLKPGDDIIAFSNCNQLNYNIVERFNLCGLMKSLESKRGLLNVKNSAERPTNRWLIGNWRLIGGHNSPWDSIFA